MTKEEYEMIPEGKLLTIKKGEIILDIFHKSKVFEIRHHNYCGEDYYYLQMVLQPKLENVSITTEKEINDFYKHKKELFEKQLNKILELKKEL